ncbi:MAG: DUF1684 domain-containing protein [Rhodovibrio sp.]|nr:DUF1684 domain-containing protein [Rhodovibrio sp.]
MAEPTDLYTTLALADWRRRINDLYAAVRVAPEPEAAWRMWRAERDELFQVHAQSPLTENQKGRFKGLTFFDYDPAFRFSPALDPVADSQPHEIDIGPGATMTMHAFARTRGLAPALGGELTLYWIGGYGGGIFLPFTDAHADTLGGGRYLLDGIKGADLGRTAAGSPILDFNFAYNPSWVYNGPGQFRGHWVCPLAPLENDLPRPVPAGEQRFDKPAYVGPGAGAGAGAGSRTLPPVRGRPAAGDTRACGLSSAGGPEISFFEVARLPALHGVTSWLSDGWPRVLICLG